MPMQKAHKAPSKPIRRGPRPAPAKKRFLHTLYLMQPLLQFAALVTLLIVFSRCSPLASSTDKGTAGPKASINKSTQDNSPERLQSLLDEEQIQSNMREISKEMIRILPENDFRQLNTEILRSTDSLEEGTVRNKIRARTQKNPDHASKLFSVTLKRRDREKFLQEGKVRIDLHKYISTRSQESAVRFLLTEIHNALNKDALRASTFLALSENDSEKYAELEAEVQVFLSLPDESKAFLELRRGDLNKEQKTHFEAALRDARDLAIVLE